MTGHRSIDTRNFCELRAAACLVKILIRGIVLETGEANTGVDVVEVRAVGGKEARSK